MGSDKIRLSYKNQNQEGKLFILIVVIIFTIKSFYIFIGGIEYISSTLAIDDSYYYFETAWNTKQYGFVTFDTFNKTNGVHFLWFWLLYFLSFIAKTKEIFLLEIMLFSLIINVLCFLTIWNIGKLLKSKNTVFTLAALWLIPSFFLNIFLIGMENTLSVLIIWNIIFYCIKISKNKHIENKDLIIVTLLLIFNVWTRYDSFILSVTIYLLILFLSYYNRKNNQKSFSLKYLVISILLICIGAFTQFFGFYLMGDSFIPVSAYIKQYNTPKLSWMLILRNICFIIAPIPNTILSLISTVFFFILNIWIFNALIRKKLHQNENQPLLIGISILSITIFLYSLVISRFFQSYYVWYLSSSFILWSLIFTFIIMENLDVLRKAINYFITNIFKFKKEIKKQDILKFLFISFFFISATRFFILNGYPTYDENDKSVVPLLSLRYDVAIWLKENTPEDAVIGSWNAGQIGFFSNRNVINLDGLINHISYYETIICNDNKFSSIEFNNYLKKMNISYIVDYNIYDFSPENNNFTKIKEFIHNDFDRPIQIWMKQSINGM